MKKVIIVGSTGSIGTQALELIARYPERFEVVGLSTGTNRQLLLQQAERFGVDTRGGIAEQRLLPGQRLAVGAEAAAQLIRECEADIVLNAIGGAAGLEASCETLVSGRQLALANKESLVIGGRWLLSLAQKPEQILPVDSEHSAIAQALRSGRRDEVDKLLLTASGGPFYGRQDLDEVTPQQALQHPTWNMGALITINSATMMNKGLELIEAHLLFDVPYANIQVVVHPQSLVHSMVQFKDGSTIAQASPPDMTLPIAYALAWPQRLDGAAAPMRWDQAQSWEFLPLDQNGARTIKLAREAGEAGGLYPAVLNASNEVAVEAFLQERIRFTQIIEVVEQVLNATSPVDLDLPFRESIIRTDQQAREAAREAVARL